MPDTRVRPSTPPSTKKRKFRLSALIAILIGVAVAAYAALFSFGMAFGTRNPAAATAVPGGIPAAQARLNDLQVALAIKRVVDRRGGAAAMQNPTAALLMDAGSQMSDREKAAIEAGARALVRMSPLSSPGLRQLALVEADAAKRERLLGLAHSTSRRDVTAAMQLAEMQFRRGDVVPALEALDRALIVSSALDETVFPMFANAATDATARRQLGALVEDDPVWVERFIRWAVANPASLGAVSALVGDIPESSVARQIGFGQQMVDLLVTQRRFAEAFRVQRAYGDKPLSISNLTTGTFQPLDWRLIDNYDSGSRPLGEDVLEIFADPGRQGDLAQVVTQLAPGPQTLSLQVDEAIGEGAQLRFGAICLEPQSERGIAERTYPLADGTAVFTFVVPGSGCDFQRLVLRIAAEDESAAAVLQSARLTKGSARAPEGE